VSQDPNASQDASSDEGPLTVGDDQLPEDLQPSEDNPLAQPADADVPDDLLRQEATHGGSGADPEDAASGADDASGTSSATASSGSEPESESEAERG
jgi:hypothetical protein